MAEPSHFLTSEFLYPHIVIDPDVEVIPTPPQSYYAFRMGALNDVWAALAFRVRKWDVRLTGNFAGTYEPPSGLIGTYSVTIDGWQAVSMIEPPGASEKWLAKILPPIGVPQPNNVLTSNGELTSWADDPVGTYSSTSDDGASTSAQTGDIYSDDDEEPATAFINVTDLELPDYGYGGVKGGSFGCIFNLRFRLSPVEVTNTDPLVESSPPPTIQFTTTPGDGYVAAGNLTVEIPQWDSPGDFVNVIVPIYREPDDALTYYTVDSYEFAMNWIPYGATENPGVDGDPMTDNDVVYQHAYDVAEADPESPTDDSRIWNNDMTAHRNPFTRELM